MLPILPVMVLKKYVNRDVMNRDETVEEARGAGESGSTILVVDDDALLRTLTSSILRNFGYTVITAENGSDAIAKFKVLTDEVGGVILDLDMPVKNGYETLGELLDLRPELRILIASGESSPDRISELKNAGAFGFIGKPFSASDLSRLVMDMTGCIHRC